MSITGIADKLLGIFGKKLKLQMDPSLQIEKELEALENEKKRIISKPQTPAGSVRLDAIDFRVRMLRKEQARIAARAT